MRFSQESLSLSNSEFTILRDLILERTGLYYENDRRDLLIDRLSSRTIECGFESFIDYYYLLKYGPGAEEEWQHVLDALSVQETYFWREMDQIRALVSELVPRFFATCPTTPLRIWSAACATGEEPLTIAMALNEAGWFGKCPIEIVASDGSPAAIQKARQGIYRERSFRSLPSALREKYFTPTAGSWRVDSALHARIRWKTVNLMGPDEVAGMLPVEIIFCRNVFIYFASEAIIRTVRGFAEGMKKPAYLFVGVSESLIRFTTDFELQDIAGAFVYSKR